MAKKVTVALIDDVDAKSHADETVHFRLDGVSYEIDLSAKNAKKLRADIQRWIRGSRRVGGRKRKSASRGEPIGMSDAEVRRWARRHGRDVPRRGRVPRALKDAFAESS